MNLDEEIAQSNTDRARALGQVKDYYKHRIVGPDLQWGPTPEVCAQIQLGAKPVELADGLTRKEAALWAYQTKHKTPQSWLWENVCEQFPQLRKSNTQHIEVMRWACRMLSSKNKREAMERKRAVFGEDGNGERDEGQPRDLASVLQRLDEIQPKDLTNSPGETLQRAVNRQMRNQWDGPDELREFEDWMDTLPPGCKVLRMWPDLFRESLEMRHCVSSYADKIARRGCVIISITAKDGRSTAEYVDGKLVQHQSFAREWPSEECVQLAKEIELKGYVR